MQSASETVDAHDSEVSVSNAKGTAGGGGGNNGGAGGGDGGADGGHTNLLPQTKEPYRLASPVAPVRSPSGLYHTMSQLWVWPEVLSV